MEFRNGDESNEPVNKSEETKIETEKAYFGNQKDPEEPEFKNIHTHPSDGPALPKPSDVRNGDLVSLLLAATPPYLYNIPLFPQTFFFSEMLKSFVQAKTERQHLKAQQSHGRRQRKRAWKEMTPPKTLPYEVKDKPLELTISKQLDDKEKAIDKVSVKKYSVDLADKKYPSAKFSSSNFSVEKLANSSITSGGTEGINGGYSGDLVPSTPPLWYPFLYPPHPPYGIDPLHFFIDLRVSAHFWDRKTTSDGGGQRDPFAPFGKDRHNSAFTVPTVRSESPSPKNQCRKNSQNVHYIVSSLKNIYSSLRKSEKEYANCNLGGDYEKESADLKALIGLETVVNYVSTETKADAEVEDRNFEFQTIGIE